MRSKKQKKASKKLSKKKSNANKSEGDWTWKDQVDMVKWTEKMITVKIMKLMVMKLTVMRDEMALIFFRH